MRDGQSTDWTQVKDKDQKTIHISELIMAGWLNETGIIYCIQLCTICNAIRATVITGPNSCVVRYFTISTVWVFELDNLTTPEPLSRWIRHQAEPLPARVAHRLAPHITQDRAAHLTMEATLRIQETLAPKFYNNTLKLYGERPINQIAKIDYPPNFSGNISTNTGNCIICTCDNEHLTQWRLNTAFKERITLYCRNSIPNKYPTLATTK
jgi:hypothetical protein